jgi:hypothetical protein
VSIRGPVFGNREIVRVIAKGGMGAVFEVRDRKTGERFAAKAILNANDPALRERFRREAEILAGCDDPGIVRIHDFGESPDGGLYMILDLVEGESLDRLLERGALEPRRAAELIRAVAHALGVVHAKGIVHRDVKPGNVLLDAAGTPKLTDFGLALARDQERLTRSGAFVGTVVYCAPEQISLEGTGPWSDVFSLGSVLFHALAGKPPIEAESAVEHMARLTSDEPIPSVLELAPSVPEGLAAIVARAVDKDPARRYQEGEALAIDLERYLRGEEIQVESRLLRILRARGPRLLSRAIGVLAVLVVVVAAAVVLAAESRRRALVTAREEVRLGRAALEGAGRGADADLAPAREHAERARTALGRAPDAGPDAAVVRESWSALALDLAVTDATAKLARGRGREALLALDALPGSPGALGAAGRLLRARALLASAGSSRASEAAREVAAVLDSLPRGARPEAFEVLGDARVAAGDEPGAAEAYGHALEVGGSRPKDLRLKGAGACAQAGDDRTAFALSEGLVPELHGLALDRAANARFARLAPAFYRRGLAAADEAASDRDLEIAWRLAPPPPALAPDVARRFVQGALRDADAWASGFIASLSVSEAKVEELRRVMQRAARVKAMGPAAGAPVADLYRAGFGGALQLLRGWAKNGSPEEVDRVGQHFLEDWPESPYFLYLIAHARRRSHPVVAADGLRYCYRAIDALPPPWPDEPADLKRFATQLVVEARELLAEAPATDKLEPDLDRLLRVVRERPHGDSWFRMAELYASVEKYELAFDAFDRTEELLAKGEAATSPDQIEYERLQVTATAGRKAEAFERAAALAAKGSDGSDRSLAIRFLGLSGEHARILATVDPAKAKQVESLEWYGRALAHEGPDARAAILEKLTAASRERGEVVRRAMETELAKPPR